MIADALTIWITKDVHKILLPSGSWKLLLIFYATVCYFRMFKAFTYIAFSHLAIWKTRIVQMSHLMSILQFCSYDIDDTHIYVKIVLRNKWVTVAASTFPDNFV